MAGRGERCLGCDPLQLSPLNPCKIITHVPSARRITLTIQLPSGATYGAWLAADWRRLLDLARTAEDAGADRLVVVDHVLMGTHADEQYHWSKRPFPPPDTPFLEPLSSLGAVAAVTHRVRLSTRILIAPLRPAALLAKSVATLDVLSGGRMELGVGVGWQREEYDAQGLEWSKRGELLTDTMGACRALWSGSPCSFRSASVTFEDVYCAPRPIQTRLPVWFGGVLHSKNLARLVDLGDGWIPIMTARLEDVRQGAEALQRAARAAGRADLQVQAPIPVLRGEDGLPDVGRTLAQVPEALEAGATDVFFSLAELSPDPERAAPILVELTRRLAAELE